MSEQLPHSDASHGETFDASLIDFLLSLTPAQRIERLDRWRLAFLRRQEEMFDRYGFNPETLIPLDDALRKEFLCPPRR